jgi:serine/threonine-protein kinase
MGVVHKVVDRKLKKVVAMKILRDGLAGSSKALDRFFREARIAASIHHRNIVEIYDYNISSVNGQSYICMELVDGPSLRDLVDERFDKSVTIELDYITETLHYVVQVFDALEATHEKRIIHRDIKPDNVMITAAGEVKITDFGIVHVEEATFTPTGAMLGTPRYMSPEQVTGAKIDGRSDIYSVGILLYEVLTGSPPFMTGDISYQQVNKRPVEPRVINSVIPQSVNDFIMRCLEKDSDARHPSAREAKGVLAQILGDLGGCKKYSALTHADTRAPAEALREPKQAKVETNSLPSDLADLDLPPSEEFSSTGDLLTHPFGADNDFDLPADFDLD